MTFGTGVEAEAADVAQQRFPRHQRGGAGDQFRQQQQLPRREREWRRSALDALRGPVVGQVTEGQRGAGGAALLPPQDGVDPGDQFICAAGLREIVIRTLLERLHHVLSPGSAGEDHDGNAMLPPAQLP